MTDDGHHNIEACNGFQLKIQFKNVYCHTNTVECIQYIYAHKEYNTYMPISNTIQYIYAHKESQYWQVNSVELIFSSFYNPVLCQQDICYVTVLQAW